MKAFLKILKRFVLLLSFVPLLLNAQPERAFFFIQLADPQFGMYPLQRDFHKERKNLSIAITAINWLHPDFVVVCGDLVNRAEDTRQIDAFKQTIAKLDTSIPLYLIPGNHDVGNKPTSESLENYRNNFGADYYSFKRCGYRFIVINTSLLKDPSQDRDEDRTQLAWLKAVLDTARAEGSHIIVFQHHPWFVNRPKEPNGYFNIPRKIRKEYLRLLEAHRVKYCFAGHLHANATGMFDSLAMVTSGPVGMPLGTSPSGIRIVIVRPVSVDHRYYGLKKIPAKIELDRTEESQ